MTAATAAPETEAAPRHQRRRDTLLAWTGGVVGGLAVAGMGGAWYFLYAPATPEPELAADITTGTVTIDGLERSFTAVVPHGLEAGAPLYVALHGGGSDGAGMRDATGYQLDVLAAREGFVVVYPDGYESSWHDCRADTDYAARIDGIDDVTFLETLLAHVTSAYDLDSSRVFGVGYSNGGHMLYRMAAESPGTFTGIQVNAASYSAPETYTCAAQTQPVATILVEGTGDPLNPYEGGKAGVAGQSLGSVLSARESALTLATLNGVAGDVTEMLVAGVAGEPEAVTLTAYGADTSTPVLLYSIEGGGHIVPNPQTRVPRIQGGGAEHLNAPVVAWEVFSTLP